MRHDYLCNGKEAFNAAMAQGSKGAHTKPLPGKAVAGYDQATTFVEHYYKKPADGQFNICVEITEATGSCNDKPIRSIYTPGC